MKDFFDTLILVAELIWLASTDKAEENEMRLQFGEVNNSINMSTGDNNMETYNEMEARHQKEVDALPIGFAFNDKQFQEMKDRLGVKNNSELCSIGAGGFCRKTDLQVILDTFERHKQEHKNRRNSAKKMKI